MIVGWAMQVLFAALSLLYYLLDAPALARQQSTATGLIMSRLFQSPGNAKHYSTSSKPGIWMHRSS